MNDAEQIVLLAELIETRSKLADVSTILADIMIYVENHYDVVDGSYEDGPLPNWAMRLVEEFGERATSALRAVRTGVAAAVYRKEVAALQNDELLPTVGFEGATKKVFK